MEEPLPGADRDRRHGLPLPGRGRLARGALAAGRRGRRRDRRVPRPTAAGTWSASTTPTPTTPAPATPARAASSTTPPTSTPSSSGSARARRWPWTRSSGCCWKSPGRRWSTPASTRPRCAGSRTGVFAGACTRTTAPAARRSPSGSRATCHRQRRQRRLRPGRLHPRPRGPGDHGRHRLLVLAGRAAPGRQALRAGRVHAGAGRRGDGAGHPGRLHRVLAASAASPPTAAASPSPRPPTAPASSEGVGLLAAGAALRRAAQRPPGPRRDPGLGGQPGRRLQRPHRPQRPLAGAGDPPGAGQRPARRRPTSTRSRPTAPAPPSATRSRPGAARHLRPGPARTGRCGSARSSPTSATPRPPPGSPA